jgi:hypothetical protein
VKVRAQYAAMPAYTYIKIVILLIGQFVFTRGTPFSATALFRFSARLAGPRRGLVRVISGLVCDTIPEAELPPRAAFVSLPQLYKTASASPHGPSLLRLLLPSQLSFFARVAPPPAPLIPVTSGNECSAPFSSLPFLRRPRLAHAASRFHQLRSSRACGPIPMEATRRSLAVSLPS